MERSCLLALAGVLGALPATTQESTRVDRPTDARRGTETSLEHRTVPKELVLRLIRHGTSIRSRAPVELLLDSPPRELESFVPENLTFVAALRSGERVTSFWSSTDDLDDLLGRFLPLLEGSGLRQLPGDLHRVFQRSPDTFPLVYCSEENDDLVTVHAKRIDEGTTDLSVHRSTGRDARSCEFAERFDEQFDTGVPLPTLHAPAGVDVKEGGGVSSSQVEQKASGTFDVAELAPGELGTHFAAQMLDQGWSSGVFDDVGPIAILSFSHVDSRGDHWVAVLTITRSAPRGEKLHADLMVRAIPPP